MGSYIKFFNNQYLNYGSVNIKKIVLEAYENNKILKSTKYGAICILCKRLGLEFYNMELEVIYQTSEL